MEILFRDRVYHDPSNIERYYLNEAPEALAKVLTDIRSTLNRLRDFPRSGRRVGRETFVERLPGDTAI